LMMSTHMAYGFVVAYFLALLFVTEIAPSTNLMLMPLTSCFALAGLIGGFFPDIDQLEKIWPKYFVHKKTLHYLSGYLIANALLLAIAAFNRQYATWLVTLACGSFGAWAHSVMDPFDGWRDDHPEQGIYEHITGRWLPSLRLVGFAGMWEWVIQAFAAVWFIAISANLSQLVLPGWQLGTFAYFGVWLTSAIFDAFYRAPKRQLREMEHIRSFRTIQR